MFVRKICVSVCAGSLAILAAGCGSNGTGGGSSSDAHISIGTFPITGALTDYVAQDKEFFKDNKIDAKIIPSMSGATAIQLMSNNKLQSYWIDFLSVLQASASGANVKVAGCLPSSAYEIVASASAGLASPGASFSDRVKALQGKTVGVTAIGAGTDRALTAILQAEGVDPKSVQRLAVGVPTAAAGQMKAGRIAAYVTGSNSGAYQVQKTVSGADVYLKTSEQEAPPTIRLFASPLWMVPGAWAAEDPAQVDDYMKAIIQARDWIVANPDEAAQIMSKDMFGGADLAIAKKSVDEYVQDAYQPSAKELTCSRDTFDAAKEIFVQQHMGDASKLTYDGIVLPRARQ
jgi:ABC-type nitrate/sulfonate/bicarbonate transport system substrate-binding protein